jgi:hypothetical protein
MKQMDLQHFNSHHLIPNIDLFRVQVYAFIGIKMVCFIRMELLENLMLMMIFIMVLKVKLELGHSNFSWI